MQEDQKPSTPETPEEVQEEQHADDPSSRIPTLSAGILVRPSGRCCVVVGGVEDVEIWKRDIADGRLFLALMDAGEQESKGKVFLRFFAERDQQGQASPGFPFRMLGQASVDELEGRQIMGLFTLQGIMDVFVVSDFSDEAGHFLGCMYVSPWGVGSAHGLGRVRGAVGHAVEGLLRRALANPKTFERYGLGEGDPSEQGPDGADGGVRPDSSRWKPLGSGNSIFGN